MKKTLIICNTHYQLIMAIQIKMKLMPSDVVDVIISDHSKGAEDIVKRLRTEHLFSKVYFIRTKEICGEPDNYWRSVKDILWGVWGNSELFKEVICNSIYDEFLYYNPDIATHILFTDLYKKNPNISISRYEEGIMSYNASFVLYRKLKIIYCIRSMLGKRNLKSIAEKFYCVSPDRYKGNEETVCIPKFDLNSNEKKIIAYVFDLDFCNIEYKQKYIFFASVYDFEGENSIGELDLAKKISQKVGKENFIVKVHPRDSITRFLDADLPVDTNSNTPWEVIQLNHDFSNNVFITTASTSVLTISLICVNPPHIIFMNRMFPKKVNTIFDRASEFCEELSKNSKTQYPFMHFISTMDELNI